MRPIINLRPLNQYLKKQHFEMDTLNKVLNLVKPNDWAISIDLTDAYLHIPIFSKHLRFCVENRCYQWKTMCFGPTSAPRVFTKNGVCSSSTFENTQGSSSGLPRRLAYCKPIKRKITSRSRKMPEYFGFSRFYNQQREILSNIVYLDALFLLKQKIVLHSQDRLIKLMQTTKMLMQDQRTAISSSGWE